MRRRLLSQTLSFLPHLYSFGLKFNSTEASWADLPGDTRAAFECVFEMESVKEVELEYFYEFPVQLLMSLTRLRYLALSNVRSDIDSDSDVEYDFAPCEVALEGLYLRGLSPDIIETLTKTLSSADGPPTLRKLALTSTTFEEDFYEAVVKLIAACGSHLTSFAWLPTIVFRESKPHKPNQLINIYIYVNISPAFSLGPITITQLHHLRSIYVAINFQDLLVPFDDTLSLLLQISTRPKPNAIEKIILECHCITFPYPWITQDSGNTLAEIWRPLDAALCATRPKPEYGVETIFGNLKEVEIILSANTIAQEAIDRFMKEKEELLPGVKAWGVVVTVRVDDTEEKRLLDWLREM